MRLRRCGQTLGAFVFGGLIGVLGGLIGLGGAEFRLPVLIGIYRFPALQAIAINLIVSLVTVVIAFIFRGGLVQLDSSHLPIVADILVGSLIGSFFGVRFATSIDERALVRIVAVFLAILSAVLIGHDLLFQAQLSLATPLKFALGTLAGVGIGVFSSMLGVAGGELIIPTLIVLFAVDIKLAGSLSLAVSGPTIIVGLAKYRAQGRLTRLPVGFVLLMSAGSIVGALVGSYLLGYVSPSILQVVLGGILLLSAFKLWQTLS